MAEKSDLRQPTHRAYSVIPRDGQDDFWLNIGLVFAHKDDGGFNIMLQALPLDGKIVCRALSAEDQAEDMSPAASRGRPNNAGRQAQRR